MIIWQSNLIVKSSANLILNSRQLSNRLMTEGFHFNKKRINSWCWLETKIIESRSMMSQQHLGKYHFANWKGDWKTEVKISTTIVHRFLKTKVRRNKMKIHFMNHLHYHPLAFQSWHVVKEETRMKHKNSFVLPMEKQIRLKLIWSKVATRFRKQDYSTRNK